MEQSVADAFLRLVQIMDDLRHGRDVDLGSGNWD